MNPGQPGQPGQEGTGHAGHGGRGGQGGVGTRGERGATGATGDRGPQRRYGPLYGYLIASAIFTVLLYFLLFQSRADSILNCERRNIQIAEVNNRVEPINLLIHLELDERGEEHAPSDLRDLRDLVAEPVQLDDCSETFEKPWPFG